jgi:exonuclease SbcC
MYLRRIQLTNYRRFKETELEFPDGIVGIIGNNGAGKSTLMEAIAWALFGTDASRTSKDQIKSGFAHKGEACRVILDFEMDGDNYQVVRELKGASNTMDASVIVNKKVSARGTTSVNQLVQNILDMDYRAFMTSFYAKQRELNALTDFQPHKRKELLARMLGIETVDEALKSLRSDKRELELRLDLSRAHLKDQEELQAKKRERSESLLGLKEESRMVEEKFTSEASGLAEMGKSWEKLKSKYKEHVHLGQRISVTQAERESITTQVTALEEERKNLDALGSEKNKMEKLLYPYEQIKKKVSFMDDQRVKAERQKMTQKQIKEIETSVASDQEKLAKIDGELEPKGKIEEELKQIKDNLDSMEKKLEEERNLYLKIESSFRSTQDERNKLKSQLENVEKLGPDSVCDRCLRPMGSDYHKIRQHLVDEQNQLEKKLRAVEEDRGEIKGRGQELKKSKQEMESRKESLQRSLERFSRLEGERQNLQSSLKEKEDKLSSLKETVKLLGEVDYDSVSHNKMRGELEQLEKLKQQYIDLASQLKRIPILERNINQLKEKIQKLEREGEKLKEEISMVGFSEDEYKSVEAKLEEKRKEVHSLELKLKDVSHQVTMMEREMNQIEEEIKSARKLEKDLKEWEEDRRYLEKLDLLFSDFKIALIGRIRPTLSRYARTIFLDLCENRYEDFELDEDYEIFIYDQGEKYPINRFSGGETDLANLCLRIAISLLISESSQAGFSFIILDEIFGSQDVLRKENILTALARLKNRFRQIFLITHIDDIKDSVENLVYVSENEDGSSHLLLQ